MTEVQYFLRDKHRYFPRSPPLKSKHLEFCRPNAMLGLEASMIRSARLPEWTTKMEKKRKQTSLDAFITRTRVVTSSDGTVRSERIITEDIIFQKTDEDMLQLSA